MTTTSRTHDQHEHDQTATSSRPDGDRSRSAVARIQGLRADRVIVDELGGQTIYAATNPDSGSELHRIALARITQPLEQLTAIWADIVEAVRPAVEAMQQVGLLLEQQPPTDPKARALWLRQHRNTGPTRQRRAPRQLDTTARRRTR